MARTQQQIFDAMVLRMSQESALLGLTSSSATAWWRLWSWVMSYAIWLHESLWDILRTDVEALLANQKVGTLEWYAYIARLFQWSSSVSYPLIVDDSGQVAYATVDTTKRIVAYSSVSETGVSGVLQMKVAKQSGGLPVKLTTTELAAFVAYMQRRKFAGVAMIIDSNDADVLSVIGNVYVMPTANLAVVQAAVEAALVAYLVNLPFNALVYPEKIVDVIQSVPEVVSVSGVSVSVNTLAAPIGRVYELLAGYGKWDTSAMPSATLTFNLSEI